MFRRRFKRCYCMNNSAYNTNNNLIEDKCDRNSLTNSKTKIIKGPVFGYSCDFCSRIC